MRFSSQNLAAGTSNPGGHLFKNQIGAGLPQHLSRASAKAHFAPKDLGPCGLGGWFSLSTTTCGTVRAAGRDFCVSGVMT
jgi:hypothetical protein